MTNQTAGESSMVAMVRMALVAAGGLLLLLIAAWLMRPNTGEDVAAVANAPGERKQAVTRPSPLPRPVAAPNKQPRPATKPDAAGVDAAPVVDKRTPAEIAREVVSQRRSRISDCVFVAREKDPSFVLPTTVPLVIEDGVIVDLDWGDQMPSEFVDECFGDAFVGLDGLNALPDGAFPLPLVRP